MEIVRTEGRAFQRVLIHGIDSEEAFPNLTFVDLARINVSKR
jgi:hypothetical protein